MVASASIILSKTVQTILFSEPPRGQPPWHPPQLFCEENTEELQDEVDDLGALCIQFSRQLRRGQTPQDEQ